MPERAPIPVSNAVGPDHHVAHRPTTATWWWWWLLVAIVALPVVGAGWQRHHDEWFPESDDATIVLLSHDTFTRRPPLVGMRATASEHLQHPELHHPGPLEMYGLAPFTHLGSVSTTATTVAVVVFNSVVMAGFGLAFRRLGGDVAGAVGLLSAGLVLWTIGADAPASVWNPYVAVLPFALLLVLAATTAAGHRWLLPWVLAVGSFVVQAHLGYVGLGGLVMAWAVGTVLWDAWRDPSTRAEARRIGAWSAVITAVLWAPPIFQQVAGHPGNLTQIWRSFLAPGETTAGWSGLAQWASAMGRPFIGWVPDPELVRIVPTFDATSLVLVLVPCLATTGLAWWGLRRGDPAVVRVVATVAVILVATAVTAAKIPVEGAFSYQYYGLWIRPAAVTVWLLLGWAGLRLLGSGPGAAPTLVHRWAVPVVLVVGLGVSALPRPGTWEPWAAYRVLAGQVVPTVADEVNGAGSAVVRFRGGTAYLSTGSAVVLALEQSGVSVVVDPGFAGDVSPWGEHRRYVGQSVDVEVWVVSGPRPGDLPDDARALVEVPILTADEQATAEADAARLRATAADGLTTGPRSPHDDQEQANLREAMADPVAAFDTGLITRLALRGLVAPPGGDLNHLVTVDRLRGMAKEDTVTVYLAAGT